MLKNIQQVLSLLGPERKLLPLLALLFVAMAVLEIISIGMIVPFLLVIFETDHSSNAEIQRFIPDFFNGLGLQEKSIILSLVMIALYASKNFLQLKLNQKIIKFGYRQQVLIRKRIIEKIQLLSYFEMNEKNTSQYKNLILAVCPTYTAMLIALIQFTGEIIVGLAIFVLLLNANAPVLFLLMGVMIVCIKILDAVQAKDLTKTGRLANFHGANILRSIQEIFDGFRELRVYRKEAQFQSYLLGAVNGYADSQIKQSVASLLPRYVLETAIVTVLSLVLLYWAIFPFDIDEFIVTIGIFSLAGLRILPMARSISTTLMRLQYSSDSVARLSEIFTQTAGHRHVASAENTKLLNKHQNDFKGFEFKNVSIQYTDRNVTALSDINLRVQSGQSIGIFGESGAGKTTLISLLVGLSKPTSGKIFINGLEAVDDSKSLINEVAYLPQEIFIMDASIAENIAMTREQAEIDNELVKKCLDMVKLQKFVEQLPNKINTEVGQNGHNVSGGQRQRIALARALYSQRNIIVMDEATSAVDAKTERELISEILALKGTKTIVCITHNKELLKNFDRIIELRSGRIYADNIYI